MLKKDYDISIVCPLLNESAGIQEFYERVSQILDRANILYELVFIDDGSQDNSFDLLKDYKKRKPHNIHIVKFSRNFGHQLAITAGMRAASGKAVIIMDCDLQDPPEVILEFIEQWRRGYEIVYGVRIERRGETFFKKITAKIFYKLIRLSTNIDIPENVGDFYLLDRKVVNVVNVMEERHRFMRGLIAWVGFKRIGVPYIREARYAGDTKYGFWKMVKFAFDAATSFSFMPLRVVSFIGSVISMLSFVGILLIFYQKLFTNTTVTGWSSLMVVILFIGGIQLLAIGIIGEYVARIGDDVKNRPLYIVRENLD